jgi:hypothetical protein
MTRPKLKYQNFKMGNLKRKLVDGERPTAGLNVSWLSAG